MANMLLTFQETIAISCDLITTKSRSVTYLPIANRKFM